MLPKLRVPLLNVMKRAWLRNVIHKQGPNCVSVVSVCYGSVPLLSRSVPDLCSHLLVFYLNVASCEFYSDSRLGILLELVFCVAEKQVRFSYARVTYEDDLKEVVVVLILGVAIVLLGLTASPLGAIHVFIIYSFKFFITLLIT